MSLTSSRMVCLLASGMWYRGQTDLLKGFSDDVIGDHMRSARQSREYIKVTTL